MATINLPSLTIEGTIYDAFNGQKRLVGRQTRYVNNLEQDGIRAPIQTFRLLLK